MLYIKLKLLISNIYILLRIELFISWSKQKIKNSNENSKLLNSTEMTNKNTKVMRKTKTRKGKSQQFPNSPKNIQNNDASYTEDTNTKHSQQE
jgi:hypothetical protein